jgi:putative inorganic carbon (HCO3(-)) transporter
MLGFILGEALLFLAGILLGQPLLGAAIAAGLVYLVLAYRHPNLAWILVWLAFPFSMERLIPGGHALHVPTEPMIALALLAWSIRWLEKPAPMPGGALHKPIAVLAGITLLSVIVGPLPGLGLKGMIAASGYVLFAYVYCLTSCRDIARVERAVPWIVGSGAVWGLYGTIRVLREGLTLSNAYGAARPFFPEHGAYAAYLAMILPAALLFALERRGRARWLYAGAALAMTLGLGLSLTRAAWVSLAIVLPPLVVLWSWWRRSVRSVALVGGLALAVAVLLVVFGAGTRIERHTSSIAETGDVSNLERFNRWMAAVEMVKDRPLVGVGYDAYPYLYTHYRRKLILTSMALVPSGAHSEIFRLLAESGIPGLLAALWLMVAATVLALRLFVRAVDPRVKVVALAVLGGLGTYAVHGLFRTYIDLEKVAVPFWSCLGVLAALGGAYASAKRGA